MGKVGPTFGSLFILVDSQWGKGIETCMTLEDKLTGALENDPTFLHLLLQTQEFLAFDFELMI